MQLAEPAYTVQTIAGILGISERTARYRAKKENWLRRPVSKRGGGYVYIADPATRAAIETRLSEAKSHKQPVNKKAVVNDRAEARAHILRLARLADKAEMTRTQALEAFAERYNAGNIHVPDYVRAAIPNVCRKTLTNWINAVAESGTAALAGNYGKRRAGVSLINQPYINNFCIAYIYKFPHVGPTQMWKALCARLAMESRPERMPGKRLIQKWYQGWRTDNEELFTYLGNPDKWRSHWRVAFGDADGLVDRLNQEWEMDSTPCDLILADGRRHTIVACIDVFSRRVIFHVSKTSSSHAVASCLRKSINTWGVPEILRTDNGADYVARHMERVLLDMDILHDVCNPFSPQEKPFVERIFRTFLHDTVETLTGYAGHNVTERKALEARRSFAQRMMTQDAKVELRLSPEELQSICDQWANNTYQHQKHSKLGCTPYEKVLSYAGGVRRVQDAEALRLLFLPCPGDGARKVQKDGVRLFNDLYISPELALHVKRHVQVRVDDADLGLIYIYNLDGTEYICAARGVKHAGLSQNDLQSIAQAARHLQNSHMRGGKASMRAAAEAINPDQTAYERMKSDDARARRIEAEQPLRAELMDIHSTPALESAADANASRSASWTPAPMTQQQIAAKEKAVILAKDAPKPKPIDAGEQRYARACNLRGRTNAGQRLNPDDERWLLGYERSNEFHRQKTLHEMRGAMLRIA